MIYDKPVDIFALPPDEAVPTQLNLSRVSSHWCAELTVYHSRYWESVQAGSSVDRLIEIPERLDGVDASMYALLFDKLYSIEQVQYGTDGNALDITQLSLKRYLPNLDPRAGREVSV